MANIKNELNDIKAAVYGEEVRNAIHDAIYKINAATEAAIKNMQDYTGVLDDATERFNQWFTGLGDMLDQNVAANLASEILELQEMRRTLINGRYVATDIQDSSGDLLEASNGMSVDGKIVFQLA